MKPNSIAIPIAIIVAGALIAGALFVAGKATAPTPTPTDSASKVPPVTADDHILGNPDAPVVIIEYTDIECPFCKQFHATMEEIMDTYGASGQVAWVVRNFPIVQLHPNAPKMAEAAECIAHLVGNAAYFKFLDEAFVIAPAGSFFPLDRLSEVAVKVGASADAFDTCIAKDTYKDLITKQFNDAVATGGEGTPHNIILTKDGQAVSLPGAQPYTTMKSVIDTILAGGK